MAHRRLLLPQIPTSSGRFFGRNVNHDGRSVAFRVNRSAAPTSKAWPRHIPILDQGNLGSCTGNATVGALGSGPNWDALSDAQRALLNEALAVEIYSDATVVDDAPGSYPPDDTGSDGLSVAKVATTDGFISGYRHIMSLGEAYAAILDGPFIVGSIFTAKMETPDGNGLVTPTGAVLGGHEWLMREYDADRDWWTADNSWSADWGIDGSFRMTSKTLAYLLAQQGDATPFVPLSAPAPQPAPRPEPVDFLDFPFEPVDAWASAPHLWSKATKAAKAYGAWRAVNR